MWHQGQDGQTNDRSPANDAGRFKLRRRALLRSVGISGIGGASLLVGPATAQPGRIPEDSPRIWPTGSNATDGTCLDPRGNVHPATGPNSASWYVCRGCGTWKVFPVVGGETCQIRANADTALLDDVSYAVQELEGGSRVTQLKRIYGHQPDEVFIDTSRGDLEGSLESAT